MSILFYTFEDQYHNKIRTIMRDNAPWFVLDDLAKVLGYAGSKDIPRDNCPNIDWFMPREIEEMNIGIGRAGVPIIPESDFYRLVFSTQNSEARPFQEWVDREFMQVLKAISNGYAEVWKPEALPARADDSGNGLQLFQDTNFGNVRTLMRDGEPWFVANDVATALGYARPRDAVALHCKYAELFKSGDLPPLTQSPYGIVIIPEPDLYALIFQSKLPKAETFRDWVFKEVIPSIRKTGKYALKPERKTDWTALREKIDVMKLMLDEAQAGKDARLLILGKLIREESGFDVLEACHIDLSQSTGEPSITTAEVAASLGKNWTDSGVKFCLTQIGLLRYFRHEYELTTEGKRYGVELPPQFIGRGKRRKVILDFMWKSIVVDMIRIHQGMTHCPCPVLEGGQLSL